MPKWRVDNAPFPEWQQVYFIGASLAVTDAGDDDEWAQQLFDDANSFTESLNNE